MTTFVYHYIDSSGRGRVHWQQAESAADCCALLAECGIYPIRLFGLRRPAAFSARGLSKRQLAIFLRPLAMAQSSGVQLSEALAHMHRGQMSERQRAFVSRIESGMHAGLAFSEALRREKSVPLLLCQWIAIGERQGQLAQVLQEICRHLENQERLKKRIQQQLLYPMIVLVTLLLVGLVLSFVVLPVLVRQFMDFNTEVPVLMRFILLVHDGLAQYGGWLLLAFAAMIVLLLGSTGNKQEHASGRGILRALVLRVPLLRKYFVLQIYVPFARLFGQMLQSSVPVGDALFVAAWRKNCDPSRHPSVDLRGVCASSVRRILLRRSCQIWRMAGISFLRCFGTPLSLCKTDASSTRAQITASMR